MPVEPSYAQPRVSPDHKVRGHDIKSATVNFQLPLEMNGNTLEGFARITPEFTAHMLGQADPDLISLNKITINKATTNTAEPFGVVWQFGDQGTDTKDSFSTVDREYHVCGSTNNVTAAHAVIPAACGTGMQSTFDLGTETKLAFAETDASRNAARAACSRVLRWGQSAGSTEADMSGSCHKVTSNNTTRYMIPSNACDTKCAMSKLWFQNADSKAFCDGAYHKDARTEMMNPDGVACTVVTSAHFDTVRSQLKEKLTLQTPIAQHGLGCKVTCLGASGGANTFATMQAAKFDPMININATLHRVPTSELLASTNLNNLGTTIEMAEHFHSYLNEDAAAAASALPSGASTSTDFAQMVLSAPLKGVADEVVDHAAVSTIEQCGTTEVTP